jgi:hypothetical protein
LAAGCHEHGAEEGDRQEGVAVVFHVDVHDVWLKVDFRLNRETTNFF